MVIFWLGVYVFVNLIVVLWLGVLVINIIVGVDMVYGMMFLGFFLLIYLFYGGLKVVVFIDII